MTIPLLHIDAFTDQAFAGNPAAVCLLDRPVDVDWMQSVAAEMNLSETAFVHPLGDERYGLRWFTPTVEVELCGHATLATAHALWSERRADNAAVLCFETASGELLARGEGQTIVLDFPLDPPTEGQPPDDMLAALGVRPARVARGRQNWVVEVATEAEVRACRPDFVALAAIDSVVIVTAPAEPGSGAEIVSRCFAPAYGIDEDPVTGSAHCLLAPWWAPRLGRAAFTARQVSNRGGELHITVADDRVHLGGRAVTVLRGELLR